MDYSPLPWLEDLWHPEILLTPPAGWVILLALSSLHWGQIQRADGDHPTWYAHDGGCCWAPCRFGHGKMVRLHICHHLVLDEVDCMIDDDF